MQKQPCLSLLVITGLLLACTATVQAQKKETIGQNRFQVNNTTPRAFVPYKVTDFARTDQDRNKEITLPNKKKIVLSSYVSAINTLESRLSTLGFDKNRVQKTIVASRLTGLPNVSPAVTSVNATGAAQIRSVSAVSATPASSGTAATTLASNQLASNNNRFTLAKSTSHLRVESVAANRLRVRTEETINALPNERFDRTESFGPPAFKVGGYETRLQGKFYLKGENDPFFVPEGKTKNSDLPALMKATTAFYTAGMDISATADIPGLGNITVYKLEAEFTAQSSASKRHSSKAKLTVLQNVMINENRPAITGDSYTYRENRSLNLHRIIGAADIFTYGINLIMPVDFYMNAVGVGAGIDVTINRTGVSGRMGPRLSQSVILETSATEMLSIVGEGIGNTVDVGVGGELRLAQGGVDFGFASGLTFNNNRLVFLNDMYAEANLELLRGRLFTFYQYPMFTCNNIIFQFADLSCWETRRVENDLFNTGAALRFAQKFVDEDKSAYVSW